MDSQLRVDVLACTSNPQQLIWKAAHQCVSCNPVMDESAPPEGPAGDAVVKHLLAGHRGHYSPLEAPQISFAVAGFPHSVMQQVTRHRVAMHYSVQSFRYTSEAIVDLGHWWQTEPESNINMVEALTRADCVFYLRPAGDYTDRQGKRYQYSTEQRESDLIQCLLAASHYARRIDQGFSEEHARGLIPFDVRQHWVMSANVRSLMHLLDLRWKADAQLECQQLCDRIWPHFRSWVPAIAQWYEQNRAKKARLAP